MSEKNYKAMKIDMERVSGDFHFEAKGSDKVVVQIDAAAAIGGTNAGARPMELLLMGLGGCSAIDVVLILKKSRQTVVDFRIEVEGLREVDAIPAPFEKIHIKYFFKGDLRPKKVEDAIRLSMEKYCSATVMLAKSAQITWSYEIENL
jgi:putative redox protein